MPNQKRLTQRLTALQAKTQQIQNKLGQTSRDTGSSAQGLTSLIDPAIGAMDINTSTTNITDQAGDMQPPITTLPVDQDVGSSPLTTQELVGQFQTEADEAKRMNELRYKQGLGIHEQIVNMFGPDSTYGAGFMDQYQREKERQLASQEQQAISRGLYNTTTALGAESDYEQRVGVPMRLQLADLMMTKHADALSGQAGFIERREDIPPDPALMANLVSQAEARPEDIEKVGTSGGGETGEGTTGSASYFSGGTGAPSYAGGGISSTQYRMEAKRQRIIETRTKQVTTLNNRLRTKNKQLGKLGPNDPKRERLEDQITQLEEKLTEAQDILDENADPIVESGIFASEQKRLREIQKKAKKERDLKYRTFKASKERVMPGFSGGGWGTSFGAFG